MSVAMSAATATATATTEDDFFPPSQVTAFGVTHKQVSQPRRMRPPTVDDFDLEDDVRTPLRADSGNTHGGHSSRESSRDSRIGLRGFFGRKSDGLDNRASIVDFGGWAYPFQGQRSDSAVSSSRDASPAPPVLEDHSDSPKSPPSDPPTPPLAPVIQPRAISQAPRRLYADSDYSFRKPIPPPKNREKATSSRSGRGSLATWDPPPLFQSYPQAIRHAQLPTCTTPVDTLLRVQGSRNGFDTRELATSDSTSTEDTGSIGEKLEKPKRRHRRNTSGSSMKLEWASKVYVLLTSGYLLQYSAEGSFDRLPEKILLLSKDSAAFASDIIPGRHWVLRVCSATEVDGSLAGDSRSLFSRLSFRGSDRRDASTFLMVFESAEDMESWITTLRREIEHLGGKKNLSETGTPKPDYAVAEKQTQPTQQALAVRDSESFTRVIGSQDAQSFSSRRRESYMASAGSAREGHHETHPANTFPIHEREPHISDDVSTTNSVYSHDSRQLDNLRDSNHRYSYLSSGQRTMFTSDTGSSPPCSPARDSFTSNPSEEQLASGNDSAREARPRPNAAAIHERRQSLQVIAAHHRAAELHAMPQAVDIPPHDPSSSYFAFSHLPRQQPRTTPLLCDVHADQFDHLAQLPLPTPPPVSSSPAVPNFSVPHSSKRFSGVLKTPSSDIALSSGLPLQPLDVEPAGQQQQQQQLRQYQQQQYRPSSQENQSPSTSPPPRSPQERKQQHYSPFPVGARNNTRKLPPPALAYSRPLSVVPDQPSPVTVSPPLSCAKPAALADNSTASPMSYSSEVYEAYEAPRVPRTGSGRASTSSQRSGSSNGPIPKSRGSIKGRLTRGSSSSSTTDDASEKTNKKRGGIQALRTALATKISNAVMSDGMSFGAPYSVALPMPISQIPVQYRPQNLLQKAASAAEKTKEMETPGSAHEIVLKAKIDDPIQETCAVEDPVYTPTRASAHLVQMAEYVEEAPLLDLPPQLPQMQPMPPMPPLPRLSQLPLAHDQPFAQQQQQQQQQQYHQQNVQQQQQQYDQKPSPHQVQAQYQPRTRAHSAPRQENRSPTTAGGDFQRQGESNYTGAAVRPKHRQPWDDMGIPVHRPPTTYRPISPASGMASYMTMDAGIDRGRGRVSPKHPEYLASRPTTPRTPGQNGHSLVRSVSSNATEDRHNMPQVIDGPPLAPPPTCALPPLPPKIPRLDVQRRTLQA